MSLGKVTLGVEAYGRALKANPSPQQRLQLQLTRATLLTAMDKDAEALGLYQDLLQQNPDYPDQPAIYAKMLPLARKLNDAALVEKCERELKRTPVGK
jgi:tetratricopeptide (TPR) repeat protein